MFKIFRQDFDKLVNWLRLSTECILPP